MKITKKQWTIIAIVGILVLIYMLMRKKQNTAKMSGVSSPTPNPNDKKSESGYNRNLRRNQTGRGTILAEGRKTRGGSGSGNKIKVTYCDCEIDAKCADIQLVGKACAYRYSLAQQGCVPCGLKTVEIGTLAPPVGRLSGLNNPTPTTISGGTMFLCYGCNLDASGNCDAAGYYYRLVDSCTACGPNDFCFPVKKVENIPTSIRQA